MITVAAAGSSLLGLVWLRWPMLDFFHPDPANTVLTDLVGSRASVVTQTILSLLGVGTGIAALSRLVPRRAIVVAAVPQVIGFGLALQSMTTLLVTGYLVGFAMPVIIIGLLVQLVRTYRRARWLIGLPAVAALTVLIIIARESLLQLVITMGRQLWPELPRMAVILLFLLIGAGWVTVMIIFGSGTPTLSRMTDWVVRHRRPITIVAACGPLPYAIARLTWLTPWARFGDPGDDLSMRIWGLTLSAGAWLGAVLTIGLIRGWGEVFPRWMPLLAGRRVPVAVAAVPGGLVAAALCFTAIPLLLAGQYNSQISVIMSLVALPCWFWGPALALAVWGYVGHRHRDH